MNSKFNNSIYYILVTLTAFFFLAPVLLARPDFDVHDRKIEHAWSRWPQMNRDTLRIDNSRDHGADTTLIWHLEVLHGDPDNVDNPDDWILDELEWIEVSPLEGEVEPGETMRVYIIYVDCEDDNHYSVDLHFYDINDPTRPEYTVPLAVHTAEYPRITTGWPGEWGGWWGIDLNNIFHEVVYGGVYPIRLRIRNPGSAALSAEEIHTDNGYWVVEPAEFDIAAGGNQLVDFTFAAEEVGPNSATITSISNAWNPFELNFRITAGVSPVFRLESPLPDTTIKEDSGELLIASLDTVFFSSDRGLNYQVVSPGLRSRVERNSEFFLNPLGNWNGISEVIVSASNNNDSTLIDTFQVTVEPMPDPPNAFDLIAPSDGDTLRWDGEDTLFVWQRSQDVDGDPVNYIIAFNYNEHDEITINVADTSISISVLDEVLDTSIGGEFSWTVSSSDGEFTRDAWSTFTNYVVPTFVDPDKRELPEDIRLVEVYPNPFNSSLQITTHVPIAGQVLLQIWDSQGRLIETTFNGMLPAGRCVFLWTPQVLSSGSYIVRLEYREGVVEAPVFYVK